MGRKCEIGCACKRHIKETHRNRQLGKKHSEATRAKMSASQRARHAANPEMTERTLQAMWDARVENGFKMSGVPHSERCKVWRSENPEKVVEANRKRLYSENGRAAVARAQAKRRAIMYGSEVRESFDRMEIFHRDGGICQICHEPANPFMFHVDHIIPISKGGLHSRSNVQTAHPWCNMSKSNKVEEAVAA